MERKVVVIALLLIGRGCQTPPAPTNPFSATGATRIPPPPTGSIGRADTGYSQPRRDAAPTRTGWNDSDSAAEVVRTPVRPPDAGGRHAGLITEADDLAWQPPSMGTNPYATALAHSGGGFSNPPRIRGLDYTRFR